jgi:carboxyl-terminal processing protease
LQNLGRAPAHIAAADQPHGHALDIAADQRIAVGRLAGLLRFADDAGVNLYGYVAENVVGPAKGKLADGEPRGLSIVYGREPPVIVFEDKNGAPLDESVVVDGSTFDVRAHVKDDGKVNDAYFFVGDQKVFYQRLAAKRGPTDLLLNQTLSLKPGVNVITVFAREDEEFAARETITVYSTKGDPFAEKKSRGH